MTNNKEGGPKGSPSLLSDNLIRVRLIVKLYGMDCSNPDRMDRQRDLAYIQARICFFSGKPWIYVKSEIENAAYHLWMNAGRPEGRELDFWLQAEHDYLVRLMRLEDLQ